MPSYLGVSCTEHREIYFRVDLGRIRLCNSDDSREYSEISGSFSKVWRSPRLFWNLHVETWWQEDDFWYCCRLQTKMIFPCGWCVHLREMLLQKLDPDAFFWVRDLGPKWLRFHLPKVNLPILYEGPSGSPLSSFSVGGGLQYIRMVP